jgi:hypothetical protein
VCINAGSSCNTGSVALAALALWKERRCPALLSHSVCDLQGFFSLAHARARETKKTAWSAGGSEFPARRRAAVSDLALLS